VTKPMLRTALVLLASCGVANAAPKTTPAVRSIALPDATASGVSMDYIAYDREHHRVWVPAGNTGNVDVVDVTNDRVAKVGGFATSEVQRQGKTRTVGPSSATVGSGVVYVGNRGDSSVCAVDAESLRKGPCVKLESMPDALVYVGAAKEVWATTPRDRSITILDAASPSALTVKAKITLEGAPEGFALDDPHGLFYTNLEDADRTLTIDVAQRKVTRTWLSHCGSQGPRGLALDRAANVLLVACTDRVKALDVKHDGKELSAIETGAGVDNIEYAESSHELYVAAAAAAKMTIARVESNGTLKTEAVVPTAAGARNAVVTADGTAYLTDSPQGRLLVVPAAARREH